MTLFSSAFLFALLPRLSHQRRGIEANAEIDSARCCPKGARGGSMRRQSGRRRPASATPLTSVSRRLEAPSTALSPEKSVQTLLLRLFAPLRQSERLGSSFLPQRGRGAEGQNGEGSQLSVCWHSKAASASDGGVVGASLRLAPRPPHSTTLTREKGGR